MERYSFVPFVAGRSPCASRAVTRGNLTCCVQNLFMGFV